MTDIFEESAKQSKHPKKKAVPKPQGMLDPALQDMFEKMQLMKENLEKQMEGLRAQAAAKHLDVDKLFGDLYHLTAKQLEELRIQEQALREKIEAVIPPEACIKKVPKSMEKMSQERSAKFRGDRHKWIPVR